MDHTGPLPPHIARQEGEVRGCMDDTGPLPPHIARQEGEQGGGLGDTEHRASPREQKQDTQAGEATVVDNPMYVK